MTNEATGPLSADERARLAAYEAKYGPLNPPNSDPGSGTTHVLLVTDMSGSMGHLADDVRGGFNTYVAGLKGKPGSYRLTATLFDQRYMPLCVDADLATVPELTGDNYSPAGSTALLDAVGRTVGEFETRAKLGDADRVLVVIQTDGQENASREWTWAAVQGLIKDREATGKWSFVYLGAGADTWDQANRMGVAGANYVGTHATSAGTRATYDSLVGATTAYAAGADGARTARRIRDEAGKQ